MELRRADLAGSWYPGERSLAAVRASHMMRVASAAPALPGKPVALIVPHAGWDFSGVAAAAAYRGLQRGDFSRVVIIGPSHHSAFAGFSINDWKGYKTPLGAVPMCPEAVTLRDGELVIDARGADQEEHSIEIQLPMLQQRLGSFCLLPIRRFILFRLPWRRRKLRVPRVVIC